MVTSFASEFFREYCRVFQSPASNRAMSRGGPSCNSGKARLLCQLRDVPFRQDRRLCDTGHKPLARPMAWLILSKCLLFKLVTGGSCHEICHLFDRRPAKPRARCAACVFDTRWQAARPSSAGRTTPRARVRPSSSDPQSSGRTGLSRQARIGPTARVLNRGECGAKGYRATQRAM